MKAQPDIQQLHRTIKFYETLLRVSNDGILITDASQNIIEVNDTFCSFVGQNRNAVIESNIFIWLEVFGEDAVKKWIQLEKAVQSKQAISNVEFQLSLNNKTRYFDVNASLLEKIEKEEHGVIISNWRDITERKQVEEKLRESEKKYKHLSKELETIFDNLPALVFYKDTENRFIRVNKYVADSYGMTKNELEGANLFDLHTKDEAQAYWEDDLEVINSGRPKLDIDESWETPAGLKWVNTSKIPFIDENGDTIGIIGISLDITERKQIEQSLRESEERYKSILENTDTGFVVVDEFGLVVEANEPYCRLVGITKVSEILGRSVIDWTAPECKEENAAAVERCGKQGYVQDFETTYIREDNQRVNIIINAIMHDSGEGKRLHALCRDITECKQAETALQESEERFRQIVERSSDVFYSQNINTTKFEYISPKVMDILGRTPEEMYRMDYKELAAHIHPDDLPNLIDFAKDMVDADNKGIGSIEREFRVMHKSGEYVWIHGSYNLIRDANGKPEFIVGGLQDITERKRAEEELRESEERFRTIFDSEPECVKLLDEDGIVLKMNPAGLKMVGANTPDQVEGMSVYLLLAPEYRSAFKSFCAKVLQGEPGIMEFEIIGLKGKRRLLESHAVPIRNIKREVTTILAVTRDITVIKEQQKLEASLYRISEAAHKEESLDALFKVIHEIILGLMPARNFYLALYDRENDMITWPYFEDEIMEPDMAVSRKRGHGITEYVLNSRKTLFINGEEYQSLVDAGKIELHGEVPVQWIGVPLRIEKEIIGVMTVQTYSEKVTLTETHKNILEFVSTSIAEAISRKRAQEEKETLLGELQEAVDKVKTLSGMIPICAWCHKIRDDEGFWAQVDTYIEEHSDVEFTHGICPECSKNL